VNRLGTAFPQLEAVRRLLFIFAAFFEFFALVFTTLRHAASLGPPYQRLHSLHSLNLRSQSQSQWNVISLSSKNTAPRAFKRAFFEFFGHLYTLTSRLKFPNCC
jgi:hypothetical protein